MENTYTYKEVKGLSDDIRLKLVARFGKAIEIFASTKTDAIIFGGAVRDAIADMPLVGDLDIIALPNSKKLISKYLEDAGYTWSIKEPDDITINQRGCYTEWGKVQSVLNYTKGDRSVQLITPNALEGDAEPITTTNFKFIMTNPKNMMLRIVADVDLCCCGVFITPDFRLFEVVFNAVEDCHNRELHLPETPGYSVNLEKRIAKLVARGWKDCTNPKTSMDMPIDNLIQW